MAIGYPLTVAGINNMAGQLAARWKHLSDNTLEFTNAIAAQGTAGLEALPVPFNSTDATNLVAAAVQLATLAGVYYGTATVSPAVNFDTALFPLRGTGPG